MSAEEKLIFNLLADDGVKKLLAAQDKTYWESFVSASVLEIETVQAASLTKLTFLLSMYAFSKPQQEMNDLVYKLLKTLPIDNDNVRKEWNNLTDIPIKDEYLSYYFFLSSIALQANKTISARLALSNYQEAEVQSDWGQLVLTDILKATLYLIRKLNGYEDIRRVVQIVENLQKEQASFETTYLN